MLMLRLSSLATSILVLHIMLEGYYEIRKCSSYQADVVVHSSAKRAYNQVRGNCVFALQGQKMIGLTDLFRKAAFRRLERKCTELKKDYDALQKKYDALANAVLEDAKDANDDADKVIENHGAKNKSEILAKAIADNGKDGKAEKKESPLSIPDDLPVPNVEYAPETYGDDVKLKAGTFKNIDSQVMEFEDRLAEQGRL